MYSYHSQSSGHLSVLLWKQYQAYECRATLGWKQTARLEPLFSAATMNTNGLGCFRALLAAAMAPLLLLTPASALAVNFRQAKRRYAIALMNLGAAHHSGADAAPTVLL